MKREKKLQQVQNITSTLEKMASVISTSANVV